jgi:raffinose/stachyose/melibiose transport system substrate-binding protein
MKTMRYSAVLAAAIAWTSGMAQAEITLSVLIDNNPETISSMEAVTAVYTAANPGVTFDIEQRTGGAEGDNIVKTRLATGEMADIFNYNSGSLFQALKPQETLADLTAIEGQANVLDSFKQVVTASDGTVRGVPFGPAMGGGIFYNRNVYADLDLSVPKSWDEFMANNAKVAEAGKVPVITTFGDTWTSQLFVLGEGVDRTWWSCRAFSICDGQPTIENCGPCDGYSVSPSGRPPHPSALSHAGVGNVID